jgi:hypothetical protein
MIVVQVGEQKSILYAAVAVSWSDSGLAAERTRLESRPSLEVGCLNIQHKLQHDTIFNLSSHNEPRRSAIFPFLLHRITASKS